MDDAIEIPIEVLEAAKTIQQMRAVAGAVAGIGQSAAQSIVPVRQLAAALAGVKGGAVAQAVSVPKLPGLPGAGSGLMQRFLRAQAALNIANARGNVAQVFDARIAFATAQKALQKEVRIAAHLAEQQRLTIQETSNFTQRSIYRALRAMGYRKVRSERGSYVTEHQDWSINKRHGCGKKRMCYPVWCCCATQMERREVDDSEFTAAYKIVPPKMEIVGYACSRMCETGVVEGDA